MNLAAFVAQFPEFASLNASVAGQTMGNAMLAAARLEISDEHWGALADQGQAYLAAHKLACSPYGASVRIESKDGDSTYGREFRRMAAMVGIGGLLL